MGLFGKSSKKENVKRDYRLFEKYTASCPKMEDFAKYEDYFFGVERYSDNYKTGERYFLRELLVLVWWGRSKSGRKIDCAKPKYFITYYHLSVDKVTKRFLSDKIIYVDSNQTVKFTEQGKTILEKYKKLWDVHSFKGRYVTNLDRDFENWNEFDFIKKNNDKMIEYSRKQIKYCDAYIKYLNNFPFAKNSPYYQDNRESIKTQKITIKNLTDNINRLQKQNKNLLK